jgi:Mrp family chromosome partitioning ATPase
LVNGRQLRGLVNYLTSEAAIEEITRQTDMENLFMILSGSMIPEASAIPKQKKVNTLIQELAEIYDYILVDSQSLDQLNQTEIVKVCDGMVLVIKANSVSYQSARKAKMKLELLGCLILGAVLLQVA